MEKYYDYKINELYTFKIYNYDEILVLPDPMGKETLESMKLSPPSIPFMHGCAAMSRDPISVCYSCEYQKDPENYMKNVKHKERLMILYEYFKQSKRALYLLEDCGKSLVADILTYLNTPRDERPYTDSQIMDPEFEEGGELVIVLRKLGTIYKNGLSKT